MKATHNGPAQALKEQTSLLHYNGSNIAFEQINGKMMINATQMAKPFGKRAVDWLNTQQAKDLIAAVTEVRKITSADIQHVKKGGENQGTWFCEEVALLFAQWLSPKFYLACNDKLKELLSGAGQAKSIGQQGYISDGNVFVKPLDTGTIKCAYVNQTLYANLTMLMRYIGYNTGLKSMANKIGEPNCIRLSDTQYLYYVNAAGAAQLMAMSNMTVSAQKYRAVFAELYRVNSEGKDLSSFDYYFTFEQMLEIMFAINQSPIKKAYVASLLSAGRTGGAI